MDNQKIESSEKDLRINEVLDRLEANDKVYEERLLGEVAIIKELRYQRVQNAKDRVLVKKLIAILLSLFLVAGFALGGVIKLAYDNKHSIKTLDQSYQRLVDCTTAGHPCYDNQVLKSNLQIQQALKNIADTNQNSNTAQNQQIIIDLQALLDLLKPGAHLNIPSNTSSTTTVPK